MFQLAPGISAVQPKPNNRMNNRSKKALIVEDDPQIAELIGSLTLSVMDTRHTSMSSIIRMTYIY